MNNSTNDKSILSFKSSNLLGIPDLEMPELGASDSVNPETLEWDFWLHVPKTRYRGSGNGYHFYTNDKQFTALWKHPTSLPKTGVSQVVECNFSSYREMPPALFLADVYKKRWLARLWQQHGIQIWVDCYVQPELYEFNKLGVPVGYPFYATRYLLNSPDGTPNGVPGLEQDYAHASSMFRPGGFSDSDLPSRDLSNPPALSTSLGMKFMVYGGSRVVEEYCERRGWLWIPDSNRVFYKSKASEPVDR